MSNNFWVGIMRSRTKRRKHHKLIRRAIELHGSQAKLAGAAQLSVPQISRLLWLERSVSAETAVAIERATDGKITRAQLRPDLFR